MIVKRVLIIVIVLAITGCTSHHNDPGRISRYYEVNYPNNQPVSTQNGEMQGGAAEMQAGGSSFWDGNPSGANLDVTKVINNVASTENTPSLRTKINSEEMVTGELQKYPEYHYAADDITGQNTASMVEGKIFKLAEEAYKKRDYDEFIRLYSLFVESFPHSSQKGFLDQKKRNFFYRENLKTEELQGALLEITYPEAKSLDELNSYFEKMKKSGMTSVQVGVVQTLGTPVFLFAKFKNREGYYFSSNRGNTVDDILSRITELAHIHGLKLYVSLPLRHHPNLSQSSEFIMDESWNAFQNRTTPNTRLDLLNPAGKAFLFDLIDDLLQGDLDGIVLKDDFTYEPNEGFSEVAIDRYVTASGQPISFNQMFVPTGKNSKSGNSYDVLISDAFDDVILWRTREIKQFLWDIVAYIKEGRPELDVGIELTPEMVLDELNPMKWYSSGLKYVHNLNVDFFILKWRKYNSPLQSDPESYRSAAEALRNAVAAEKEIYLKVPLSHETKNTIVLNRVIDSQNELQKEFSGMKFAIGPVDRTERLDIMN